MSAAEVEVTWDNGTIHQLQILKNCVVQQLLVVPLFFGWPLHCSCDNGVAIKLPADLTICMPRLEDQLARLTGVALVYTSLEFYVPSLGIMGSSQQYGNLAALSVTVVNESMQLGTGFIFAFRIERFIIMICILLLPLLMWSSTLEFRGQPEYGQLIIDTNL